VKHTKGPWSLETVKTSDGLCHKIGPFPWKDDRQNHACIYVKYPGAGPIEEELLANARLIAAAPDLLMVARMAVMLGRLGGMLPGVKQMIDSVVEDAELAIKLAEDGR
jgi:hypothetical protein